MPTGVFRESLEHPWSAEMASSGPPVLQNGRAASGGGTAWRPPPQRPPRSQRHGASPASSLSPSPSSLAPTGAIAAAPSLPQQAGSRRRALHLVSAALPRYVSKMERRSPGYRFAIVAWCEEAPPSERVRTHHSSGLAPFEAVAPLVHVIGRAPGDLVRLACNGRRPNHQQVVGARSSAMSALGA